MTIRFFHFLFLITFGVICSQSKADFKPVMEPLKDGEHVVFLGDSITQFGNQSGGYLDLLRKKTEDYRPKAKITITGKGVGEDKVSDLLKRFDEDVLKLKPSRVVIFIGTNDVWHWTKPDPVTKEAREGTRAEDFRKGLEALLARCQEANIAPSFCTPAVIGENVAEDSPEKERLEAYCEIMRSVASEHEIPLLDLRERFVSYLKRKNPKGKSQGVLTKDTVNLSGRGNRFVADAFEEFLSLEPSFPSLPAVKPGEAQYDLYLLIGQSNMAGRASITNEVASPLLQCDLFSGAQEWEQATNPLNRFSTVRKAMKMQKLGPGYGFAQAMISAQPDRYLGLVVNARGGTKIQAWAKGKSYYKEALQRAKAAQKFGNLKGILWHQGEGNSKDKDYLNLLTQLVNDLRLDLEDPDLPFVAGQIIKDLPVNDQLSRISEKIAHSACVSSADLSATDGTHFDTKSQLELGKRYAEAMLGLQKAQGEN